MLLFCSTAFITSSFIFFSVLNKAAHDLPLIICLSFVYVPLSSFSSNYTMTCSDPTNTLDMLPR